MKPSVVVMGVAGCGKSSLAEALARSQRLPLVEGDAHHSPASREKMQRGIALSDEDRAGWLDALARELQAHPDGVVMTCSALKRAYRQRLRAACPGLRFLHLAIDPATARQRIEGRGSSHFFSPALVESQFATLEPPDGEPGVLTLDGTRPQPALMEQASRWLQHEETQA